VVHESQLVQAPPPVQNAPQPASVPQQSYVVYHDAPPQMLPQVV
jgi:hypothetical protein